MPKRQQLIANLVSNLVAQERSGHLERSGRPGAIRSPEHLVVDLVVDLVLVDAFSLITFISKLSFWRFITKASFFCLQLDYQTVLHLSSRLGHWKLTGLFCSKEIGAQVNPRYGHYLYFQSLLFLKFAWGRINDRSCEGGHLSLLFLPATLSLRSRPLKGFLGFLG